LNTAVSAVTVTEATFEMWMWMCLTSACNLYNGCIHDVCMYDVCVYSVCSAC